MNIEDIFPGVVVRNTKTKKIGVLFTGHVYEKFDQREVPIIYQGDDKNPQVKPHFELTSLEELEEYELEQNDLLTWTHIEDVCKLGKAGVCRYLIPAQQPGAGGYNCAKILSNTNVAERIDGEAEKPDFWAKGNNCGGRYSIEDIQRQRALFSRI